MADPVFTMFMSPEIRHQVRIAAAFYGISSGEFLRRLVINHVANEKPVRDILVADMKARASIDESVFA